MALSIRVVHALAAMLLCCAISAAPSRAQRAKAAWARLIKG